MIFRQSLFAFASFCLLSSIGYGHYPENNAHVYDSLSLKTGITEAQFNDAIDQVEAFYRPLYEEAFGAKLVINRNWRSSTVNASASINGSTWTVNMYGGLARRAEVTKDGFSKVLCHEVGHHVGGYPYYSSRWAAAEGQADYFATLSCARELWRDQLAANAKFRKSADSFAREKCDDVWDSEEDQNLCYRAMMAGKSLGELLSNLGGTEANFDTPDQNVVTKTATRHPVGQCRLDTYMAGALCEKEWDPSVIAGKQGSNSASSETKTLPYTCMTSQGFDGYLEGVRPSCWFKSVLN
ncbi:MAG: hypothetical protein CMP10_18150 [Zetaproteobacteria bacterium]|nr:hypothetical protein [Pseudobdellovibrionaceae bacterium]